MSELVRASSAIAGKPSGRVALRVLSELAAPESLDWQAVRTRALNIRNSRMK
jgi:hypothetical protein